MNWPDDFVGKIIEGDCLDVMKDMPNECIDLIVTDPPYGAKFMGKEWDKAIPSVDVWKEALRVLKPGAFAFVMSFPRQDLLSRMIVNLEDAGFMTNFTSLYWTYATGFPKAGNVGKLVDKRMGKERKELDGSYTGFQPKPALECILVVMKKLSEKTYIDQALTNRKGITWLDDARIPFVNEDDIGKPDRFHGVPMLPPEKGFNQNNVTIDVDVGYKGGRFPANLLVSNDVLNDGKVTGSGTFVQKDRNTGASWRKMEGREGNFGTNNMIDNYGDSGSYSRYFSLDAWAEKNLPKSVKKTFPFMIVPKASSSEKNKGLEELPEKQMYKQDGSGESLEIFGSTDGGRKPRQNFHPTCKPVKLMAYLVTIGSRPGDVVLDPFCGSGTTCVAAEILNRQWVGIELSPDYCEIARARVKDEQQQLKLF